MTSSKIFIGPKIKALRLESGLTQAGFGQKLGISTSYLNQLENNQRHASATVLMALAQNFAVDIRTLSDNESERLLADLMEATNDTQYESLNLSNRELKLATKNTPDFVRAFLNLHKSSQNLKEYLADADRHGLQTPAQLTPYEEVRDYYHYQDNYFDTLDRSAEDLSNTLASNNLPLSESLSRYLSDAHGIKTIIGGLADHPNALRYFDTQTKTLHLNPYSAATTHNFQMAHQIAQFEKHDEIERLVNKANFQSDSARDICKIGLANYFAGGVTLPYTAFFEQAKLLRHDLDLLSHKFQSSLEQVCHRLSTLQRPGQAGIPFFFARVDQAGNITKRHSATKLQFAQYGSACPLWNVHQAFEVPGRIIRQLAETPDGEKYLCIATAIKISSGGFRDPARRYALALGCETKYIGDIVYGDDLSPANENAFEQIGISCRICERKNCHQRSVPPLRHRLSVDPNVRSILPYKL